MGKSSGETSDGFHLLGLTKLLFAHPQGVLRPSPFQPLVKFPQGSLDGGNETPQALLGNVIGGTVLHHVDGKLFSLCIGDKQKRHVGMQGAREGEGGGSVEAGDGGISKDETEPLLAKCGQKLLTCLRLFQLA